MKVEVIAHLDFEKDISEIEDGMTEDEIDNYLFDYILDFLDWSWKEVEEWTNKNEEKRRKNRILCSNVFKIANRQDWKDVRYKF